MKSKRVIKLIAVGACMAIVFVLSSCSKKVYFTTSPVVPAARGYVKVKKDNNKNYMIDISISDLAEVQRLQGNKKVYVVWMSSNMDSPKNMGQINSDTKMFSKKLTASFHSVSATKPTRVFITAEEDGAVQYPGNFEILSTEIM
jgi:hypothetical protein